MKCSAAFVITRAASVVTTATLPDTASLQRSDYLASYITGSTGHSRSLPGLLRRTSRERTNTHGRRVRFLFLPLAAESPSAARVRDTLARTNRSFTPTGRFSPLALWTGSWEAPTPTIPARGAPEKPRRGDRGARKARHGEVEHRAIPLVAFHHRLHFLLWKRGVRARGRSTG